MLYSGNTAGGGSQTLRFRDRPEIRVDGTRLIATGAIAAKTGNMWAVDVERQLAELLPGRRIRAVHRWTASAAALTVGGHAPAAPALPPWSTIRPSSGWDLEGSWILTGETKAYSPSAINNEVGGFNVPVPSRPFSLNGDSWGAWELVARYSDTNLNWHTAQVATTSQLAGIAGGDERIVALGVNWYLNRNIRLMLDDNIVAGEQGHVGNLNRDQRSSQDINVVGLRFQYAN